jgi:hypothetical protein
VACYVNEDRVAFSTPPWHGACEVRFHGGDKVYCQRGEAGNRIKETPPDLFGTRTSCHKFLANWLRSLLASHHPLRPFFLTAARALASP